ncbi:hypothetical protein WA026_020430 [Henosepilachna vigintioctopunctata]|uniref:Uncharacterized protein n=1 Tax=Henosepilachna vigintioctopunctata TaxID=420089 RepID=A0AAW1UM92_9CUCU
MLAFRLPQYAIWLMLGVRGTDLCIKSSKMKCLNLCNADPMSDIKEIRFYAKFGYLGVLLVSSLGWGPEWMQIIAQSFFCNIATEEFLDYAAGVVFDRLPDNSKYLSLRRFKEAEKKLVPH